jgi:ribosomal protein S18 acetylase RimI-like enzyme
MDVGVAGAADVDLLGRSLAVAYETNPLVRWMFADDLSSPRLISLFSALVGLGVRQGQVYRTRHGDGAAIWFPPVESTCRPDPAGGTSEWSSRRRAAAPGVLAAARPPEAHIYLDAVGVVPAQRRRGVASELLAPVLARCDRDDIAAYLENSDPANIAFYARNGFEEIGPLPMPVGCPPIVAMRRNPRPAR